ncbi:MAG: NADH:ubiquinone reductase (Na(+)-transporting) subunit C [Flavobacteriales bacterium]|jgi:Na+-transporting NADH:ubiquinone oxidoreductase subunit C|nr:NADH:ubiquinone reductase (Na(+)-transporting) subunit C [Flavobacteriaceae bacterium]MDP4952283.1 NADH:ubiquinone reductase (Na(+)-transporting) subunit C [Flavobacteriales bacterium]
MGINKNSTGFTFGFAIVMVVVVGSILAFLSISLKDLQNKNAADKKMMDILGAIQVDATRANAADMFEKYVKERIAIDFDGNVLRTANGKVDPKDKKDPFNIDTKKDYKNEIKRVVKTSSDEAAYASSMEELGLEFAVYRCEVDNKAYFVVPMVGTGLWGPIWGYVSVEDDMETIYGAKFDHQGETPGLGAEIKESDFQKQFVSKKLNTANTNDPMFVVKKAGQPDGDYKVDGITGGTITSKGVEEMMDRTFDIYTDYFKTVNQKTSQLR